jgi:hypothetical protein
LSTKWTDKIKLQDNSEIEKEVSWLDLMNKGKNSGGPVPKNRSTEIFIGISTFILNPYAKYMNKSNLCKIE